MAEGIDYLYNAKQRVKVAILHPNEATALDVATIALAEATVALAEQQRVASVIHLMSMPTRDYDRLVQNTSITAIREALGLA